jgi:hypothetical protein
MDIALDCARFHGGAHDVQVQSLLLTLVALVAKFES